MFRVGYLYCDIPTIINTLIFPIYNFKLKRLHYGLNKELTIGLFVIY